MTDINPKLQSFLEASWRNPVFGDTFPASSPHRLQLAAERLGAIATAVVPELGGYIAEGMPDQSPEVTAVIVKKEILDKTLAFVPALTLHMDIDDVARLQAVTTAVGLMYWGDQTMDRGDTHMPLAIRRLPKPSPTDNSPVGRRARSLSRIEDKVAELARPEDAPLVLPTFYDQVLLHEVRANELSQAYEALAPADQPAFLTEHAREFAEITTISAGLPSVACSIYAIRRQHDPSLPSLPDVYADSRMTDMLQVSNVIVRLWDDYGDCAMDAGDTDKGVFAINPFNQYHPAMVERFCELAHIDNPAIRASMQAAFKGFHDDPAAREVRGAYILATLRNHIRGYMERLEASLRGGPDEGLLTFVNTVKPVVEIGYVNTLGDIAMSA
jgi:hypothetical protein